MSQYKIEYSRYHCLHVRICFTHAESEEGAREKLCIALGYMPKIHKIEKVGPVAEVL